MPLSDNWGSAATYTHLGVTLAAAVLVGFFGGNWLDGKLGSDPWLAILGAFAGATGGFINLIRTLTRMQEEKDNSERNDKD